MGDASSESLLLRGYSDLAPGFPIRALGNDGRRQKQFLSNSLTASKPQSIKPEFKKWLPNQRTMGDSPGLAFENKIILKEIR